MLAISARALLMQPGYAFVLLGACAMSLGCKLRPRIRQLLKKHFPRVELPPEADEQIEMALIGPKLYKSGEPYHFDSPGLIETMMSASKDKNRKPNAMGGFGMNVPVGGLFGVPKRQSARKPEDVKLVGKGAYGADRCAGCGDKAGEAGSALRACGGCKTTMYCGKECRKQHWKLHKDVCVKKADEQEVVGKGGAVQAAA
jgi:hypothetical protein